LKNKQLAPLDTESRNPTEKLAPRIVLLLDSEGLVVSAKNSLAHPDTTKSSSFEGASVHDFMHANCSGDCGFTEMWIKARNQLQREDFVEWELSDRFLQKLLRFNLTRPPSNRDAERERRRHVELLTIRDITQYRQAHESLKRREEELVELVRQQSIELSKVQRREEGTAENSKDESKLLTEFEDKIRHLSRRLILAQENERKRIATDLHDGIAQSLAMLKFSIEGSIEKLHTENKSAALGMLRGAADQIKGTVEDIRRISWNLTPTMLDDWGLQAAIERLCEDIDSHYADLKIECSMCLDELCLEHKDTPHVVSIAIYRVVQESLNNAIKHAGASLISVAVEELDDGISLTVSDDGMGFQSEEGSDQGAVMSGLGIGSMRDRIAATGGLFEIKSEQGHGTIVRATWSEQQLKLLVD
jgi:signal transduction histidine kinase